MKNDNLTSLELKIKYYRRSLILAEEKINNNKFGYHTLSNVLGNRLTIREEMSERYGNTKDIPCLELSEMYKSLENKLTEIKKSLGNKYYEIIKDELDFLLDSYERLLINTFTQYVIDNIDDLHTDKDIWEMFHRRNEIEGCIDELGTHLPKPIADKLNILDEKLKEYANTPRWLPIVQKFPEMGDELEPKRFWWWHLKIPK